MLHNKVGETLVWSIICGILADVKIASEKKVLC